MRIIKIVTRVILKMLKVQRILILFMNKSMVSKWNLKATEDQDREEGDPDPEKDDQDPGSEEQDPEIVIADPGTEISKMRLMKKEEDAEETTTMTDTAEDLIIVTPADILHHIIPGEADLRSQIQLLGKTRSIVSWQTQFPLQLLHW